MYSNLIIFADISTPYSPIHPELEEAIRQHSTIADLLDNIAGVRLIVGGISDVPAQAYFLYVPVCSFNGAVSFSPSAVEIPILINHIQKFGDDRKGKIFLLLDNFSHILKVMQALPEYIVFATYYDFMWRFNKRAAGYINQTTCNIKNLNIARYSQYNTEKPIDSMFMGITYLEDNNTLISPIDIFYIDLESNHNIYDLIKLCYEYFCNIP